MNERKIIRNAVRCRKCGDIIESKRQHHFVRCSCKATFVDGGLAYLRRGFGEFGYDDLSEYAD